MKKTLIFLQKPLWDGARMTLFGAFFSLVSRRFFLWDYQRRDIDRTRGMMRHPAFFRLIEYGMYVYAQCDGGAFFGTVRWERECGCGEFVL